MEYWKKFLKREKDRIGEENFKKWLLPIKVISYDARNIYLEATNLFQISWFEEHIKPRLHLLVDRNHKRIRVHLNIKRAEKKVKKNKREEEFFFHQDSLDTTLNLKNFYPTEESMPSYKIFEGLINEKHSPPSFNPIFIHGPKGCGKTHILTASLHILKEHKKNVFFVKAQTFTNHVVNAIRLSALDKFRKKYRHVDALIIDDIDILSGRKATQEELFHTFNTLHSKGCQIIIASSSPPQMLKDIESRLISRFEWGLVLFFKKADRKICRKILEERASFLNLKLNEKVKEFLLNSFPSASGIKKSIEAIALRMKDNPEIDDLKEALKDLISDEEKLKLNHERIVSSIAEYFGIRPCDILGRSQTKECSFPRQLAIYFCRKKLNLTYQKIGDIFQRDHSTIISAIKNIEEKKEEIKRDIQNLENPLIS